jgi:Family of unknown function (DUF6065)
MTTEHASRNERSSAETMVGIPEPNVEFFLFNADVPPPEPASPTLQGTLPLRGVQKCTPLTDATGFGWYTFPPVDFALRWDGQTVDFSRLVDNEPAEWRSLSGGYDLALDEDQAALARAPERFKADFDVFDHLGGRIAFINMDPRLGNACEITPGLLARTSPGWSLLVRSLPNWPPVRDHQILEGVVDTDWFGSHVPIIVRLPEVNRVVRFYRRYPWAVLQPVPRVAVTAAHTASGMRVTRGIENFPDDIWARFVENRRRRVDGSGLATYQAEQRRRARVRQ